MAADSLSLSALASAGFRDLAAGRDEVAALCELLGVESTRLLPILGRAADPELALAGLRRIHHAASRELEQFIRSPEDLEKVARVLGVSEGLSDFFVRHPSQLDVIIEPNSALPTEATLRAAMLDSVE